MKPGLLSCQDMVTAWGPWICQSGGGSNIPVLKVLLPCQATPAMGTPHKSWQCSPPKVLKE